MSNYSNYEQGDELYRLANGVLGDVAAAASYPLTDQPESTNLGGLIARVGPDKELQKNISCVRETLGEDARGQIAEWVENSGIMVPVERSLLNPQEIPSKVDTLMFTGGVANWMLRRSALAQRFDPENVGRLVLPIGNRVMGAAEHQLVATYERTHGQRPTEAQFAETYLLGSLSLAGFYVQLIPVETGRGDQVLDALFAELPSVLDGNILVAANAPNAIQAAGELRLAGKRVSPDFDDDGDQVYMASDSIPLARNGEAAKTHQNPETALGQLVRNAKFLVDNNIVR